MLNRARDGLLGGSQSRGLKGEWGAHKVELRRNPQGGTGRMKSPSETEELGKKSTSCASIESTYIHGH